MHVFGRIKQPVPTPAFLPVMAAWFLLSCTDCAFAQATDGERQPAGVAVPQVTLILPSAEGGSGDRIGRIVAKALERVIDAPVRVQNVGGGAGVTGTNAIAKVPRDGSFLGLALSSPMVGGRLLSRAAEFSPLEDFDWLAILGTYGNVMVVRQDDPARSFREWLERARDAPQALRYGTIGSASAGHIAGEFLRLVQHANLAHVSFGVNAEGYAALAKGEIDVLFAGVPSARAATVPRPFRVIAVTSNKRDPSMPDVPAFGEFWRTEQFEMWAGIVAPSRLPAETRSRLAAAIGVMLADKRLIAELQQVGVSWQGLAGKDASQFVKDDILRMAKQIGDLAIQPVEPARAGNATRR